MSRLGLSIVVCLTLCAGVGRASVLCVRRNGAVSVRDACKRKETVLDPAAVGLSGPLAGTPAGGALAGTYPDPVLAPTEAVHVVGAPGEPPYGVGSMAYGSSVFPDLGFYKDALGIVHLTGLFCFMDVFGTPGTCASGVLVGGQLTIFTLPEGYRPAAQEVFVALSYGGSTYFVGRIDVDPLGTVSITAPPNEGEDWVSLSGITFRADH